MAAVGSEISVEQRPGDADEDAAEDAGVHRIDAHDRLRREAEVRRHDAERREEHDEATVAARADAVVVGQPRARRRSRR
jgi:hypothetical protein